MRLSRADEAFRNGSELLAKGEANKARAEFDRAVALLLASPVNAADRASVVERYQEMVEAIYRLEVDELPMMVANDTAGGDLYEAGQARYRRETA